MPRRRPLAQADDTLSGIPNPYDEAGFLHRRALEIADEAAHEPPGPLRQALIELMTLYRCAAHKVTADLATSLSPKELIMAKSITRRNALTSAATIGAAVATTAATMGTAATPAAAALPTMAEPDPIFAQIERHRAAFASAGVLAKKIVDPADTRLDAAMDDVMEIQADLAGTEPKTLAGVVAVIRYAREVMGEGEDAAYELISDTYADPRLKKGPWLTTLARAVARIDESSTRTRSL
jgi:hypothetical protein